MRLNFIPLATALVPAVGVHISHLMAACPGHVWWCFAYFPDCLSSRCDRRHCPIPMLGPGLRWRINEMTTVHLSGIINHQTSTEARGQLLAELRHQDVLHIDLSHVTWIDGSGLAILVEVYQFARKVGRKVRLINVSHSVQKRINLEHLEGVFALRDDNEDRTIH